MKNVNINQQFQIGFEPLAAPEAIITSENVRFTVLTPRLIRMEYSLSGQFEDRPSQVFWYRKQPVTVFRCSKVQNEIEIDTEYLNLKYRTCYHGFTKESLTILLKSQNLLWRYGDVDRGNLYGTARTLDQADGKIQLEQGLLSRDGWTVIDDSQTLVFNENSWLENRSAEKLDANECKDLYFFGYGMDYKECLKDYFKLTGKVALLPRWALGNWWSRYWEYSQTEYQSIIEDFNKHEIPLSVCPIDMDWHVVKNPHHPGWTGYTWNKELFPDPTAFLSWLREQGLKIALNLHPADGIHPHEEQYEEMARFMNIDPDSQKPVEFDIIDPQFAQAYFDILHHPLENQGIDFWWMDWQQGDKTKLEGLDPLWILNHLHFYDLGRDGSKRPFIFSRWGGLGNHRYPIGFSGDTIVSWNSLSFQPYFTATASNVGFSWWSHDIGGHFKGRETPELYARWVQFGVFSPIMRLHSTKDSFLDRRPWSHGAAVYQVVKDAMQLRHALIPYLYTMSWLNYSEDEPFIKPMYYENPASKAAYECPNQYWYGTELIVAPFVQPANRDTKMARQVVWLPEGDWFNFFSGEHYYGGKRYAIYGGLQDIPVFAKAGAIIPLAPKVKWGGIENPSELNICIFPGASNHFELYEDDGETMGFTKSEFCITSFIQEWEPNRLTFKIEPPKGQISLIPPERRYQLTFKGITCPQTVAVKINGNPAHIPFTFDYASNTLSFESISISNADRLEIVLFIANESLVSSKDMSIDKCLAILKSFPLSTASKNQLQEMLKEAKKNPLLLYSVSQELTPAQMLALTEILFKSELYQVICDRL
jgi:alpha-glucosidase (family GH31 glycosyl hydrolase)